MRFRRTVLFCASILVLAGCAVTEKVDIPEAMATLIGEMRSGAAVNGGIAIELNVAQEDGAQFYPGKGIRKEVTIVNSADSGAGAYVWYTYALPRALANSEGKLSGAPLQGVFADNGAWIDNAAVYSGRNCREIVHKGQDYVEYVCLYRDVLMPGKSTPTGMKGVRMDGRMSWDDSGNCIWKDGGRSVALDFDMGAMDIPIRAHAVSAAGFSSVEEAYFACAGQ